MIQTSELSVGSRATDPRQRSVSLRALSDCSLPERKPLDIHQQIHFIDPFSEERNVVPRSIIPKLAGLIDDLDSRGCDAQTRGRHQSLYLLAAGFVGALRVRPWAFDAGPPIA